MYRFIKNRKLNIIIVFLLLACFGFGHFCHATTLDVVVTQVMGWIASMIFTVAGWIITTVIKAVISIASYNNFINETPIVTGWKIVRDLCNMFFILILLIIAFATILRVESYNVKKLLPKLLIMAVLINFSRTICGLFIDFSQVIMLTFVNAFAGAPGNFVAMLKVKEFVQVAKDSATWGGTDLNLTNTVAGMILAIILMIVATIAMLAILVVFVMRVIMLWIYITLSPLAFLLSAFPAGQKYSAQYWGEFSKYIINGPVLAFFIWLALATMNNMTFTNSSFLDANSPQLTSILQDANFMAFVMAIGFITGGLMVSQQIGGIGSSWGMNTAKNISNKGAGFAKKAAIGAGVAAAVVSGKATTRTALRGAGAGLSGIGGFLDRRFGRRDAEGNVIRGTVSKLGTLGTAAGTDMRNRRMEQKTKNRLKTLEKFGMGANTMTAFEQVRTDSKVQAVSRTVRGAGIGAGLAIAGGATGGLATAIAAALGGVAAGMENAVGRGIRDGYSRQRMNERQTEVNDLTEARNTAINSLDSGTNTYAREMATHQVNLNNIENNRRNAMNGLNSPATFARNAGETDEQYDARRSNERNRLNQHYNQQRGDEIRLHETRLADPAMRQAQQEHADERGRIISDFDNGIAGINRRYGVSQAIDHMANASANFRVGELTGNAIRRGTQEIAQAQQRRNALTADSLDFNNFSGSAFFNQSGPSSAINRLFDTLGDRSTESTRAINNMTRTLQNVLNNGLNNLSRSGRDNILQLKQGIASQMAGGRDIGHLQPVINIVNQMDVGEGGATVEQLRERVVARS